MKTSSDKKKQMAGVIPVGVAWYETQEDWAGIKSTAMDPERFENTYEEWKSMAAKELVKMVKAGILPVKISLTPEEFSTWCVIHNRKNNAENRADYAALKMREIPSCDQQA
ncbi:MAG: hypothetical protein ACLFN6_08520 [Desulfonatronovibrio sp.]